MNRRQAKQAVLDYLLERIGDRDEFVEAVAVKEGIWDPVAQEQVAGDSLDPERLRQATNEVVRELYRRSGLDDRIQALANAS